VEAGIAGQAGAAWCDGQDKPAVPDEVEDPGSAVAWECDLVAWMASQ
jgi:hypothetical protein